MAGNLANVEMLFRIGAASRTQPVPQVRIGQ